MNYSEAIVVVLFWLGAAFVLYVYFIYPLILAVLAKFLPERSYTADQFTGSFSVVLVAFNEAGTIGRRLEELTGLIASSELEAEVIVVSDGSTDDTAAIARKLQGSLVRILELPRNVGKARALSAGCALARNEVIVFADARQSWCPQALRLLLKNFSDPTIGAAGGDLVVQSAPGLMGGIGLYWRYEKWLRKQESRVHSTVGVTGAISAVRRQLFHPIPQGIILDDVYWPLLVAMQGFRVVHDEHAYAYDRFPEKTWDEFKRKVRTLSGNFQLIGRLPGALVPWKNPVWFQFLSHKLSRLLIPWALLAMLGLGAVLRGPVYQFAFWSQIAFYATGLVGIGLGPRASLRPVSAAASFLVLNSAAWLAFWVWISGNTSRSWTKILYPASTTVPSVDRSTATA